MENFELLGSLALKLHHEFRTLYYLLLPLFFSAAIAINWFKHPQGGPEFVETFKRVFIGTLLLVGFPEITDAILFLSNGIADKISDMSGFDAVMQMASEKAKGYTLSPTSVLLAFNDLIVSAIAFLSYIVLYVARYFMVAMYHFSWTFLCLLSPILLLFHLFSPKITLNMFKALIEVSSWKIVWSVLSAMLKALPFGTAYMMDGNYLTVIVLNFMIAIAMLCTPLIVRSLIGGSFTAVVSGIGGSIATAAGSAAMAAPAAITRAAVAGRQVVKNPGDFMKYQFSRFQNKATLGYTPIRRPEPQRKEEPQAPNKTTAVSPRKSNSHSNGERK